MLAEMAWPLEDLTYAGIKIGIIIIALHAMRSQPFNCCLFIFGIHATCETVSEPINLKPLGLEDFSCNVSWP